MRLHERLEDAYTVELIMTPREQLYCVQEGELPPPDAVTTLFLFAHKAQERLLAYSCVGMAPTSRNRCRKRDWCPAVHRFGF